jgi:hypothetical protein
MSVGSSMLLKDLQTTKKQIHEEREQALKVQHS